jgi:hypothetical protein
MKKLFFVIAFICAYSFCFSQTSKTLPDGLYLVDEVVKDSKQHPATSEKAFVHFNKLFQDNAPEGSKGLMVITTNFVPLELNEEPQLVTQADAKKKIQLSFSKVAADKLTAFTSNNVMKQATIIIGGEALIIHKIRAVITSGKMELSSNYDDAYQHIYLLLKDNVKH